MASIHTVLKIWPFNSNLTYTLLDESESGYIANRPYINDYLTSISEEKKISPFIEVNKR